MSDTENKTDKDPTDKNDTKRISFRDRQGKRQYIRLGNVNKKMAASIKTHIEKLVVAHIRNVPPDKDVQWWVESLSDNFHARVAKTGLVPERKKVGTLAEMLPNIIKDKSIGNAQATVDIYGQAEESLYRYFGRDRQVDTITATNAKEYSLWLAKHGRLQKPGGLAPKTISKRMQHAFSFFDKMIEKEIISRNPFKGLVQKVVTDDRRKGIRKIPFFPHVEECLTEAFEQAPEGAIYVVEKHAPLYLRGKKERVYVCRQGNIGTTFRKIILRAGIVPWGKLIHNLRASFETDLLNGEYGQLGIHTIAKWLGHSVQVMLQHYGRHKQSDYDQIAEARERVKRQKEQKMAHSNSQNECLTPGFTVSTPSKKTSPKAAPHTAARGEFGSNRAESPSCTNVQHALENKAHEGSKRQEMVSLCKSPKLPERRARESNPQPG